MNHQALSSFIWSGAVLLRGDYKQSDYGTVILFFTVLRRLDCVPEPTKAVLVEFAAKPSSTPTRSICARRGRASTTARRSRGRTKTTYHLNDDRALQRQISPLDHSPPTARRLVCGLPHFWSRRLLGVRSVMLPNRSASQSSQAHLSYKIAVETHVQAAERPAVEDCRLNFINLTCRSRTRSSALRREVPFAVLP